MIALHLYLSFLSSVRIYIAEPISPLSEQMYAIFFKTQHIFGRFITFPINIIVCQASKKPFILFVKYLSLLSKSPAKHHSFCWFFSSFRLLNLTR